MRHLDVAFDVTGDWAICALHRIVHAGLQSNGLRTLQLHGACQAQTVHGLQKLSASVTQPPAFSHWQCVRSDMGCFTYTIAGHFLVPCNARISLR